LALAGGLALANRALLLDDLPPMLPGAPLDWQWCGWRVRYTVLGTGSPLVLVHGIHAAASSFEMRNVFEPLSQQHRVYALDLLGFGKSERPDARYTGQLYRDLIGNFLANVVEEPAVLVATSLSAAYAVAVARARPALVSGLVLISPTSATPPGPMRRIGGAVLGWPLVGSAAFNALVSRASMRRFLTRVYADERLVDEALLGQQWATSHQPNARLAPAAFVAGNLSLPLDEQALAPPIAVPILVVRGTKPGMGRPSGDEALRALGPDVTVETIAGVGQIPHDEAPERFVEIVEGWLLR
jgi:pimeloyl-ACP methyl ester carboxylesterase